MTAVTDAAAARARLVARVGRSEPLSRGAVCLAICAFMLAPIVFSVLASVKTTARRRRSPPTYFPHELSLDNYARLWSYQAGLPTYFFNSLGDGVHDDRVHAAPDDPGRLRAGAVPDPGQGGASSSSCCWP